MSRSFVEIDKELYKKLVLQGVLKDNSQVVNNSDQQKITLDQQSSEMFENGLALGKYLIADKEELSKNDQSTSIDSSQLQQLQPLSTSQAKAQNWEILSKELDKVGISVDQEVKRLIIDGDHEQICLLFARVDRIIARTDGQLILNIDNPDQAYQRGTESLVRNSYESSNVPPATYQMPKKTIKDGVDMNQLNPERPITEVESSLEFILNTLCRSFTMKPKQAAALLTNNNQFLIHSIIKGIKGQYEPVLGWYQELYSNNIHLSALVLQETEQFPQSENCQKVLATISCGMFSHSYDVCLWCSKLVTKVCQDLSQHSSASGSINQWYTQKDGGLELNVHALKKHPEFAQEFVSSTNLFCSKNQQYLEIYKTEMMKHFPSPIDYTSAINDLFPFLAASSNNEIKKFGLLDYWIETFIELSTNRNSTDERIASLTFLSQLWLLQTSYIDQKEDLINSILIKLKDGLKDDSKLIKIVTLSLTFRLLDQFAEEKNHSAPAIYKALISALVENPIDETIRQLFFLNFTTLFQTQSSIPIGLLIDPLIKQLQSNSQIDSNFYKIFDFDFFSFISNHPKFTLVHGISLADLLAKIIINDVVNSRAAQVAFVHICQRFIYEAAFQEFISKFASISITSFMNLEKTQPPELQQLQIEYKGGKTNEKKQLALPAPPIKNAIKKLINRKLSKQELVQQMKEQEDDAQRKLKKSHVVNTILKILDIKYVDVNNQIKDILLTTNKLFNDQYGYFNKAIMAILAWYGDANTFMNDHIRAIEDQKNKEKEEKLQQQRLEKERMQKEAQTEYGPDSKISSHRNEDGEDRRLMVGYNSEDYQTRNASQIRRSSQSVRNSMALVPYNATRKPSNRQKVLQQIEKIKKGKIEQEVQKKIDEERQRLLSARKKKKLKEEIDKRKLTLGIVSRQQNNDLEALLFKEGTIEKDESKQSKLNSKMMVPQINMLDLDQEEERDKEAVSAVMKKYAKLWKNLFYKYSNSGFSSKQISTFDQLNDKLQTMSFAEMTKLLKDHDAFPKLINKDTLAAMFRLVNTKLTSKSDLQALDYNGYLAFIPQLANYCFTKPPKDLSHLPPVETVNALISHFEEATKARGNSLVLYQDTDATSIGDQQLIKALNEKLKNDSQYPIPEGYFKQIEKTPIYEYRLSEQIKSQMSEKAIIGTEIMDELLNQLFGIHIFEPLVTFEERLKVRPMIKNQKTPAEALSYMKQVEKKIIKPIEQRNSVSTLSTQEKSKVNQEVKPQLNVALKLEVAKYPLKERPLAQEVAEVFEEMLQAVEKGQSTIAARLNRAPGQVWNEAKQKKVEGAQKESEFKINQEDKRKKRNEQVKSELQKLKEQKEKEYEEQKKAREEKEKKEKDVQKKLFTDFRKKLGQQKTIIEQKKTNQVEKTSQQKQEEELKSKEAEDKKKKDRVEFFKKQKQKMTEEFSMLKKTREDVAAKEEEIKQKDIEYQKQIRQQMENYVKENQQDRGKEQAERQQINEFLEETEVKNLFALYENSLRYMFKFYASQDKKDLDFNLERSMNTMNLREFIRFNYQQNIVPAMLQPDDIVQVFRQVIRERIEIISGNLAENYLGDKVNAQVIDFEYFKKALIRIAIMAQDSIGGLKEDLLVQKLENQTKLKEEEQRKKDKLKKLADEKSKAEKEVISQLKEEFKQQTMKSTSPQKGKLNLEINEAAQAQEDQFFEKWMKQRESKGTTTSVKDRISIMMKQKAPPQLSQASVDDIKLTEELQPDSSNRAKSQQRTGMNTLKTSKNVKLLKDLAQKQTARETLAATKIENKRIRKDLNVGIVTAKTIEGMLKFLGIEPEDNKFIMDKKLNEHRIEIQGQKPNRVKKQIKPNRFENIKQDLSQSQNEVEQEEITTNNFERDEEQQQQVEDEGN